MLTQDEQEQIAQKITDRLFVNGVGQHAERLLLVRDRPAKIELGGWCKQAVIDQILDVLSEQGARS